MTEHPSKILVVDDVDQNIRLLNAMLTPRGYTVIIREFLDKIRALCDRKPGGAA